MKVVGGTRLARGKVTLAIELSLIVALCLSASHFHQTRFSLHELRQAGPFTRVLVWAPSHDTRRSYPMLLFLHGSQPASISDPNWFAEIRHYRPFDECILVVPAVRSAEEWSQPPTIEALDRLLNRVSQEYPVDTHRTYLAGFSSGASQGFRIAAALAIRFAGYTAMAANMPRSMNQQELGRLANLPILLVCMEYDAAVPCARQLEQMKRLRAAGVSRVEGEEIHGIGHECPFEKVAPVLARWMALN